MKPRCYFDWNATTPLRPSAKAAMIEAMELVGNPSSVHTEGRFAKNLLEKSREIIANALGAEGADIIFTSGATEAAHLSLSGRNLQCAGIEHNAVLAYCQDKLKVAPSGQVEIESPEQTALQLANSETGIIQNLPPKIAVSDLTQAFGKIPLSFNQLECEMAFVSAHKLGGPKGIGALVVKQGINIAPHILGGGQEMGRRAGTENLIGIAGFAAATQDAMHDLSNGVWDKLAEFRNILNLALSNGINKTIFVGEEQNRLPNTLCMIAPGWKGETQIMAMDLAGFAISAGSACSSGKVRTSRVLTSMGYDETLASQAVRISLGPGVKKDDILRFAECWSAAYNRALAHMG